jgi:hypothetical protein
MTLNVDPAGFFHFSVFSTATVSLGSKKPFPSPSAVSVSV